MKNKVYLIEGDKQVMQLNLDQKIHDLKLTNSFVNRAFSVTDSELDALKLAVIGLATALDITQNEFEKPQKFEWKIMGKLAICPECELIKEVSK